MPAYSRCAVDCNAVDCEPEPEHNTETAHYYIYIHELEHVSRCSGHWKRQQPYNTNTPAEQQKCNSVNGSVRMARFSRDRKHAMPLQTAHPCIFRVLFAHFISIWKSKCNTFGCLLLLLLLLLPTIFFTRCCYRFERWAPMKCGAF